MMEEIAEAQTTSSRNIVTLAFFLEYAIFCESINMLFEPFIISIRWVSTDLIMIFVEKNIINSVYQLIKWFFFSYDQVSDDLR